MHISSHVKLECCIFSVRGLYLLFKCLGRLPGIPTFIRDLETFCCSKRNAVDIEMFVYRMCIIVGVILLVASTRLARSLPRSWIHVVRSGVDKNIGVRQSVATRSRDTSPSTVIQASTLHHLIATPSKAKA